MDKLLPLNSRNKSHSRKDNYIQVKHYSMFHGLDIRYDEWLYIIEIHRVR